jgi:hypothetical protein
VAAVAGWTQKFAAPGMVNSILKIYFQILTSRVSCVIAILALCRFFYRVLAHRFRVLLTTGLARLLGGAPGY